MDEVYRKPDKKYSQRETLHPKGPVNKGVTRFSVSQINIETFTVKLLDADPKVSRKLTKALKDLPQEDRRFDSKLQKWFVYSSDALRSWLEVTKKFTPLIQWGARSCDSSTLKAIVADYEGGAK